MQLYIRTCISYIMYMYMYGGSEGGSKVIRGIIARKEGEPGNEATHLYVAKETCGTRCL